MKKSRVQHLTENDMIDSPYHFAIIRSNGNLSTYTNIAKYIEPADGDINDLAVVKIGNQDPRPMTAVIYASYLGYVDIVESLLSNPMVKAVEKKYETMARTYDNIQLLTQF